MPTYAIQPARATGGKAGKGCNKTSTLQVVVPGNGTYQVVKMFRFKVGDRRSYARAQARAVAWCAQAQSQANDAG